MMSMKRWGSLAIVLGLGFLVVLLMGSNLSTAAASGDVDLTVELQAPTHISDGATYTVRIPFYNLGGDIPPDAQVTVMLPLQAQLIDSTDRWGDPLPPAESDGNTLTWTYERPNCYTPLDANCGHIILTLQADEGLPEGTQLETQATVTTSAVDSDMTNNTDSSISRVGAMAESRKQVHAQQAMPGDVLTYTITLERSPQAGVDKAEWATLTDTIPYSHQARFLGWTSDVTGTMVNSHTLRWQGRVQAGKSVQLQYQLGIEGVVTPGTVISNSGMLSWGEQLMQLGPVSTVITLPHGAVVVEPGQQGETHHQHGVTLTIPPGAVSETTRFQIGPLFTDTWPSDDPPGQFYSGRAFELQASRFGHQVTQFGQPLTVTMSITDSDIHGLKRETLRLWTRSGPEGPWAQLDEPARVMSGSLSFTTTHFSQFALFGEAKYKAFLPLVLRP